MYEIYLLIVYFTDKEKGGTYTFRGHRFVAVEDASQIGCSSWSCAHCLKSISGGSKQPLFGTINKNKGVACLLCHIACHKKHMKYVPACNAI